MPGYDTAGEIQNTYVPAHNEFGVDPGYWLRYFTPSPAADIFANDAVSECTGAWNSGGPFVGAICAPVQSRLSGSKAEGQADGQSMGASMVAAHNACKQLALPSGNQLWCWLDQEASTSLSLNYWNGWSGTIANYNFAGKFPLYPGLYCNPFASPPNCTTIAQATGLSIPVAVWASVPEPCGTIANPPPYNAEECSSVSSSKVKSKLWQFGEQGVCGLSANVDLDVAASGVVYSQQCFQVTSKP